MCACTDIHTYMSKRIADGEITAYDRPSDRPSPNFYNSTSYFRLSRKHFRLPRMYKNPSEITLSTFPDKLSTSLKIVRVPLFTRKNQTFDFFSPLGILYF